MKTMQTFDRLCYFLCLAGVAGGLVLALILIWGGENAAVLWKLLLTCMAVVLASGITLGIRRNVASKDN